MGALAVRFSPMSEDADVRRLTPSDLRVVDAEVFAPSLFLRPKHMTRELAQVGRLARDIAQVWEAVAAGGGRGLHVPSVSANPSSTALVRPVETAAS